VVEGEWAAVGELLFCFLLLNQFIHYSRALCVKPDRGWGLTSPRHQGIDFRKVTLVDALSSGLGLQPGGFAGLEEEILRAIRDAKKESHGRGKVLLVLDGMDFLLAATGCPVQALLDLIAELREVRCRPPLGCYDSTASLTAPARPHDRSRNLSRSSLDAIANHTVRNLPCCVCDEHGVPKRDGHER